MNYRAEMKCLSAAQYSDLMIYVFDDELDKWFNEKVKDIFEWHKNEELVKLYEKKVNDKKDEWWLLHQYWTPEYDDKLKNDIVLQADNTDNASETWGNILVNHISIANNLNEEAREILKRAVNKKVKAWRAEKFK